MPIKDWDILDYECDSCGALLKKRWHDGLHKSNGYWTELQDHNCISYLKDKLDDLSFRVKALEDAAPWPDAD
tara:strand:- start:1061 stop:1276 length:216 start_codon:yes stop_codon:yes gene_type:complete